MRDFEFLCRCGSRECNAPKQPHADLLLLLAEVSKDVGGVLRVYSGMRCKLSNARQGGVPISGHINGTEADIVALSTRERHVILASAYRHGAPRIGIGEAYVHIGVKSQLDQQVTWLIRSGQGVMGAMGC